MSELARRNPDIVLVVECQEETLQRSGVKGTRLFDSLSELGLVLIEVLDDDGGRRPLARRKSADELLKRSRWFPINLRCSQIRQRQGR